MMAPIARIIHQTRSRVRLRIEEKRKDPEFFEQVRNQLDSVSGIMEFKINSITGCIVISHPEQSWPELEEQLGELGLFEIAHAQEPGIPETAESTAFGPLQYSLSRIDQTLSAGSAGKIDLRTLAYIGLMVFTIRQIMKGQVLGPALPMLWNALSLADRFPRSGMDGSD